MAIDYSVGTTTANSYVSVQEADAYFLQRANSAKWEPVEDKEAALITASRLLDWQLKFDGEKVSATQSMQFPRTEVWMSDGLEYPSDIIPSEIKYAVFELAYLSIGVDRTADNALAGIDQVKAGPLFIKSTPAGYGSTKSEIIPQFIKTMISDFIVSTSIGVVRLMRA